MSKWKCGHIKTNDKEGSILISLVVPGTGTHTVRMKFTIVLVGSLLTVLAISAQLYSDAARDALEAFDNEGGTEDQDAEEEESFSEDEEADDQEAAQSEDSLDVFKRYLTRRAVADKDFIQTAFDLSNKYRAKHGAPALVLDDKLNEEAQAYAEHESSTNVQKHSCGPCDKYGENLAYKASTGEVPTGVKAAEWAVNSWYDEVSLYPFDNPGGGDMHKWGHFTALVWKSSAKMGIGVAYGSKTSKKGNKMKTVYVVARYLPPGNMLTPEAMKENVLPAQ